MSITTLDSPTVDSSSSSGGYLVFAWDEYGGDCCGSLSTCGTVVETGDACASDGEFSNMFT